MRGDGVGVMVEGVMVEGCWDGNDVNGDDGLVEMWEIE